MTGGKARRSTLPASGDVAAHRLLLAAAAGSAVLYGVAYLVQRSIAIGHTQVVGVPLLATHMAVTLALFALYLVVLALSSRRQLAGGWLALALGTPVAVQLLLLFAVPTLSIDLLSYLAHGYIRAELQGNPYVIPASAAAATPLGPELVAYGWRPVHPVTSYGPLWTHIEAVVAGTVEGTLAQLFVLKGVVVATSLGSAALIWTILGWVAPQDQRLGTLAWLWNPVVVMELAGDGHNDALVVLLVLLALASTLRGAGGAGLVTMALGILTKYLPALLLPVQARFLWRTRRSATSFLSQVVLGGLLSVGAAVALFRPLWVGPETLAGVRMLGQTGLTGSTPSVITGAVSQVAGTAVARPLVAALAAIVFAGAIGVSAWWATDGRRLLDACAAVSVTYLLVASPAYYPWYVVLPVSLLSVASRRPGLILMLALSAGSRLVAPLDLLYVQGVVDRRAYLLATWTLAIAIPAVVLTAGAVLRRRKSIGHPGTG